MISSVTFQKTLYNKLPFKFEAGTPNVAGGVGLGAAIDYLESIGMANVAAHEQNLLTYGTGVLSSLDGFRIIGTANAKAGILSFIMDGVHPHDIGTARLLDSDRIDLHGFCSCGSRRRPAGRRIISTTVTKPRCDDAPAAHNIVTLGARFALLGENPMALWKGPEMEKPATAAVPNTSSNPAGQPAPAPTRIQDVSRNAPRQELKETIISAGLSIDGKIEGSGHVRIAGQFNGDVHVDGNLTIEPGAKLTGGVRAKTVTVGGELEGNIDTASMVELTWVEGGRARVISA